MHGRKRKRSCDHRDEVIIFLSLNGRQVGGLRDMDKPTPHKKKRGDFHEKNDREESP